MLYIIIYARQKYKDIANNIENICKQKTNGSAIAGAEINQAFLCHSIACSYSPRSNKHDAILFVQ
jgi:hypothetical protein